jgi:uncharacterized membrane protein required for colicin V production
VHQGAQDPATAGHAYHEFFTDLSWVDATSMGVLAVFFVLGLFKGLIWQVSRVAILVAAYYGAMEFGEPFAQLLVDWTHTGPAAPSEQQETTALCIAFVLLFLFVLVGLSLFALFVQSLARKAGLGFYDRLFGGVLGTATGALVILVLMTGVLLFLPPGSQVAQAAQGSHSLRLLQDGIEELGPVAPPALRRVFCAAHPASTSEGDAVVDDGTTPRDGGAPVEANGDRDAKPVDGGSLLPPDGGEHRDH